MLQQGYEPKWLNVQRYAQLRASMGGGGGYRTSGIKLGDVGLQQDKYFSKDRSEKSGTVISLFAKLLELFLAKINPLILSSTHSLNSSKSGTITGNLRKPASKTGTPDHDRRVW